MTVRELFESLDRDSFIYEYNSYCKKSETVKRQKMLNDLLDSFELLETKPEESQIVFCTPSLEDSYFDTFIIKKEDLLFTEIESGDLPQHYAYELCSMTEVLGYTVSDACIYAFGEYKVACTILYEMTFFGYDLDEQKAAVTQESNQLTEAVTQIKEGLMKGIPFDQVLQDIGFVDERKDFEKTFDTNKFIIEGEASKKLLTELCKLEIHYLFENLK